MSVDENMRDELFIDQEMCVGRPEYLVLIFCFVLRQFRLLFSARIAALWIRGNLVSGRRSCPHILLNSQNNVLSFFIRRLSIFK
jgi:hypothetical protein